MPIIDRPTIGRHLWADEGQGRIQRFDERIRYGADIPIGCESKVEQYMKKI